MAYRLRYCVNIDWVGPGMGPMSAMTATPLPGGGANAGPTLEFVQNPVSGPVVAGAGSGGALSSADITTLTNAMAADLAAQMNVAAVLARLQLWISGGT